MNSSISILINGEERSVPYALIDAAPALLAALERIVNGGALNSIDVDAARAAIRAARGESA